MKCPNCTCSDIPKRPDNAGPDDVYRWALLGMLNRIAIALETQNTALASFVGRLSSVSKADTQEKR